MNEPGNIPKSTEVVLAQIQGVDSRNRLLPHSRGRVGASGFQAPGFEESRGSAEGSGREGWLITGGVSWVVLWITRGVNGPWIAAESAPGFGGRRRSGIRDPCRDFPGL